MLKVVLCVEGSVRRRSPCALDITAKGRSARRSQKPGNRGRFPPEAHVKSWGEKLARRRCRCYVDVDVDTPTRGSAGASAVSGSGKSRASAKSCVGRCAGARAASNSRSSLCMAGRVGVASARNWRGAAAGPDAVAASATTAFASRCGVSMAMRVALGASDATVRSSRPS